MVPESDKVRARRHMGYGAVQESSTFVLGMPAAVQTAFMIEGAWARILPSSEKEFFWLLDKLDDIEAIVFEDTPNTAATKIGNIELNQDQFARLMERYKF